MADTIKAWLTPYRILVLGISFGAVVGHFIYDYTAMGMAKEVMANNPGRYREIRINYFNYPHWEHLLYGMLGGLAVAVIVGLVVHGKRLRVET